MPRARKAERAVPGSPGAELVATLRWLADARLYSGTSGNVSVRDAGGFLITPSGVPFDEIAARDMVPMSLDSDGEARGRARLSPSTEWRIHRDIYRSRPDAGAVVHSHAPFATTVACLRRDVPAFHYMVAKAGGPTIRCARYATYGTEALSRRALEALERRNACLLANHGMVVLGADLRATRLLAQEVEGLCEAYWRALAVGEPAVLSGAEMANVLAKFRDYGRVGRQTTRRRRVTTKR
jgi:L-fuculose-phosphate aldolase